MKPFGLEGKVGAPAIVKTNPLLRTYDEEFVPMYDSHPFYRRAYRILIDAWPFTWRDVLGVVQERYAGIADAKLQEFIKQSSQLIPDPVLTYDLDTPELSITVRRQSTEGIPWPQYLVKYDLATHRLIALPPDQVSDFASLGTSCAIGRAVHLTGACHHLDLNNATALIDGDARNIDVENGLCVVRGRAGTVLLHARSLAAFLTGACVDGIVYSTGPVLSAIPIRYFTTVFEEDGVICDPGDNTRIHDLYRSIVASADNPDALLLSIPRLRKNVARESGSARKRQIQRQMNDIDKPMTSSNVASGTRHVVCYQFTPRGAPR